MQTTDHKSLAAAVLNVMKAVQYVEKKGTNAFHNYSYAREADVVAAIRTAMIANGLILLPTAEILTRDGAVVDEYGMTHVQISYDLVHAASGESRRFVMVGSGSDKNRNGVGDKGVYKAITGAHKYALLKVFQVETGDDPEDERQPELAPPERTSGPPPEMPEEPELAHAGGEEPDPVDADGLFDAENQLSGVLTREEIRRVVERPNGLSPVMREPGMGDERSHPWAVVEEVFRQFAPLHETNEALREFYKINLPVLQIMERETPQRKRAVDAIFKTCADTIKYRNKDNG